MKLSPGIVTISLGTATWSPESGRTAPQELVAQADAALYAAKRAGRDRTHSAQPRDLAAPAKGDRLEALKRALKNPS